MGNDVEKKTEIEEMETVRVGNAETERNVKRNEKQQQKNLLRKSSVNGQ